MTLRRVRLSVRRRVAWSASRQRSAALVVTLALALVGAPAVSAVRNECNLCPRTCPMHHDDGDAQAGQTAKLKCHSAPAESSHHQHATAHGRGPSLARASCGNHGLMPATVLPPVILSAALARVIVAVADAAPLADTTWHGRLADPPDTPPPISAA